MPGIVDSAFGQPPFGSVAFGGAATRPPIVSLISYVDPTAFAVLPDDAGGGSVGTTTGGTSSAFGVPAFGSVAFGGAREAVISALVSDVDPTAFVVLPNDSAIGEVDPTGFLVLA